MQKLPLTSDGVDASLLWTEMIFSSWKRELGGELRALDTIISQIVRLLMPAQSKCLAEKLQCAMLSISEVPGRP